MASARVARPLEALRCNDGLAPYVTGYSRILMSGQVPSASMIVLLSGAKMRIRVPTMRSRMLRLARRGAAQLIAAVSRSLLSRGFWREFLTKTLLVYTTELSTQLDVPS